MSPGSAGCRTDELDFGFQDALILLQPLNLSVDKLHYCRVSELPTCFDLEQPHAAQPRNTSRKTNVLRCVRVGPLRGYALEPVPVFRLLTDNLFRQSLNKGLTVIPCEAVCPKATLHLQACFVERMDLHLVWMSGRIYIKPLPRYLLEPYLWHNYLACTNDCNLQMVIPCQHLRIRRCALGFLFSYAALIRHESDFSLAKEANLLPGEVSWTGWRCFVGELLSQELYSQIDERFYYGELRQSRLNMLQYLTAGTAYVPLFSRYGDFFRNNLAWLTSATIYVALVLTAMQVGLGTSLGDEEAFQTASYGFTIFAIFTPLVSMLLILVAFLCIFIWNWVKTVEYGKKRFHHIRMRSAGSYI
ncbi:hypothetical protein B0I35DRAFT_420111 [Stachybotrys elegans]|uniref:Uncharacterized protein n=1 Tax=Stachybotrys elegans TaxID=80388 RepID=A0A8K0T392_9HYPO|nr:hypothetical protein B0I35DRAFT_420111 [Stachybotrys elegans]